MYFIIDQLPRLYESSCIYNTYIIHIYCRSHYGPDAPKALSDRHNSLEHARDRVGCIRTHPLTIC